MVKRKNETKPLRRTFIREWRESRGLSQDELVTGAGEILGERPAISTFSRLERGEVPYEQFKLEAYAKVLGCREIDLLVGPPADSLAPDGTWVLSEPVSEAIAAAIQTILLLGLGLSEPAALEAAKAALKGALDPPLRSLGGDRVASARVRTEELSLRLLRRKPQ